MRVSRNYAQGRRPLDIANGHRNEERHSNGPQQENITFQEVNLQEERVVPTHRETMREDNMRSHSSTDSQPYQCNAFTDDSSSPSGRPLNASQRAQRVNCGDKEGDRHGSEPRCCAVAPPPRGPARGSASLCGSAVPDPQLLIRSQGQQLTSASYRPHRPLSRLDASSCSFLCRGRCRKRGSSICFPQGEGVLSTPHDRQSIYLGSALR